MVGHVADRPLQRLRDRGRSPGVSGPSGRSLAAHARRNFEELTHDGTSVVGLEAVRRFARIYGVEAQLKELSDDERRAQRQQLAKPLWKELKHWLQLERRLVADGGPTAKAIDSTLGHWAALTRHLDDGARSPSTTTTSSVRSNPGQ